MGVKDCISKTIFLKLVWKPYHVGGDYGDAGADLFDEGN